MKKPRIDTERHERLIEAMRRAKLDALVLALPKNVLLATGYYPVVGTSIAIVTKEGKAMLIAPEDEASFYDGCDADKIFSFQGTLEQPTTLLQDISGALKQAINIAGLSGRIGIEFDPASQEASYIAANIYGAGLTSLLNELTPNATFIPADDLLDRERSIFTSKEQQRLKLAVAIAERAYLGGASKLEAGMTEIEAAQYFQVPLSTYAIAVDTVKRAEGKVSCMSGINSGTAYGAFAMSSRKTIGTQDLILTHCNSHADGYWTDITRTFFRGEPPERILRMYEALLAASRMGINAVKPGVKASHVDSVVRESLTAAGFGDRFKHGTGHGVGFSAIDHRAIPRLRPNSPDVLQTGMVMNIEPGIYFEDFGGMRHCDMILVTPEGCELLTPFQHSIDTLIQYQ